MYPKIVDQKTGNLIAQDIKRRIKEGNKRGKNE